ncbi:MAG: trigger factor [Rhodothermales bacterium]
MQTTIKQVGPVEYELEVSAKADDLAQEFQKALRAQQARTQMKGFRPGKVPLSLVKKMYGEALGYGIADKTVQETYQTEVLDASEYDVLGQPKITTFEYEMDGDLHAVVQFGVRPEVELKDLSGEKVDTLIHEFTEEEVEAEIQRILLDRADLVPVEGGAAAGEEDMVVFDLQELDAATRTPIIGKRDEDRSLFLNDPHLDDSPLLSVLRDTVLGAKAGDTVRFQFEHDKAHDLHVEGHAHAHFFEATVKEIKRRDVPEFDDEFVKELTSDRLEDVAAFRDEVAGQIKLAWAQRTREFLEGNIVERMLEIHPVPVPASVLDVYLDSYVEDVKQRNKGELPPGFDEGAFRAANHREAEQQARWMLIRDRLIDEEQLVVSEEDMERFYEQEAEKDGRLTAEQLGQFYRAVQMTDQVRERVLNRKVFDLLASRFELVEKDRETIERELEERRAEALARVEELRQVEAPSEPEEV